MPNTGSTDSDKITFIVGNPRSKQNLSKIRRHASKAPKHDVPTEATTATAKESPTPPESSSSPGETCAVPSSLPDLERSHTAPSHSYNTFPIQFPQNGQVSRTRRRLLEGIEYGPSHSTQSINSMIAAATHEAETFETSSPAGPHSDVAIEQSSHLSGAPEIHASQQQHLLSTVPTSVQRTSPFTTIGITLAGTWFEQRPSRPAETIFDPTIGTHEKPHIRSRQAKRGSLESVWDASHGSLVLTEPDHTTLTNVVPPRTQAKPTHGRQHRSLGTSHSLRHRKHSSGVLRSQWRVGPAPARPLALPDTNTAVERILLNTGAYYTSRFDAAWRSMLLSNSQHFDSNGQLVALYESNLSIAALVEAGRPSFANLIIERNLGVMKELFVSDHPRLYGVLSMMALDTSDSVLGQVHRKFAAAIIPLAREVLGDNHPCTLLLRTSLPTSVITQLSVLMQLRIHEHFLATFGDVWQTQEGAFLAARVYAQCGQTDEALNILRWLRPRLEGPFGMNSIPAMWLLLDEANIYLGQGIADIKTEMTISDALRRIKVLESNARFLTDKQKETQRLGLGYEAVAALRLFGKLHLLRKNFIAAVESYRQAVDLARDIYGDDAPATQLAQGDYEKAENGGIGPWTAVFEPTSNAEEEVEVVETMIGKLTVSRTVFGREAIKVPVDKTLVYGMVPYGDLKWREGLL